MSIEHKKTIIPISRDAAYIECSCGWKSKTGYDDDQQFVNYFVEAEDDFKKHLAETTNEKSDA